MLSFYSTTGALKPRVYTKLGVCAHIEDISNMNINFTSRCWDRVAFEMWQNIGKNGCLFTDSEELNTTWGRVCFTALLTCDSFLSSHLSSFYLTGVFSQLRISVLLNQMPAKRRSEHQ